MNVQRLVSSVVALATGCLLASASLADKPQIFRYETFDVFDIVECDGFMVMLEGTGWNVDKWWYDDAGAPVRLLGSYRLNDATYYNDQDPSITLERKGSNGQVNIEIDFTGGDWRASGPQFILTVPGMGHILLDTGIWSWDASTQVLSKHGPNFALADGETGFALCEALAAP